MRWSSLKKRAESLFAESVKGRVELHYTCYRKAHDQDGRGWITIDKREIINMATIKHEIAWWQEYCRLKNERDINHDDPERKKINRKAMDAEAETIVHDQGIFSQFDFSAALYDYLNLPIDSILSSTNPIIRAIGMLDARVGKRKLAAFHMKNEHDLVRLLYHFRCSAEEKKA